MPWQTKLDLQANVQKDAAAAKERLELLQEISTLRLEGYSVRLISVLKGVTRQTIYGWMEDPIYKELHGADFTDSIESHRSGLVGALPIAVAASRAILEHPLSKPSDKLAAAQMLLHYGGKVASAVAALAEQSDEDGMVPIARDVPRE